MGFAEKLISLRKKKGLSQEQLADALDVSRQAVYKWESGTNTPEIEKIKIIAEMFNVSLDVLLNDDKNLDDSVDQPTKKPLVSRGVYKTDAELDDLKADYDHGIAKKCLSKVKGAEEYFAKNASAIEEEMAKKGYDEIIKLTPDINAYFFVNKANSTVGFYFDHHEQFVCPIESVVDVRVSSDGESITHKKGFGLGVAVGSIVGLGVSENNYDELSQARLYTLNVSYIHNGIACTYELDIPVLVCKVEFSVSSRQDDWETMRNLKSRQTLENLNKIRDKISALKVVVEGEINQGKQLPTLDVKGLEETASAAKAQTETERKVIDAEYKKEKNKKLIRKLIVFGVIALIIVILCCI